MVARIAIGHPPLLEGSDAVRLLTVRDGLLSAFNSSASLRCFMALLSMLASSWWAFRPASNHKGSSPAIRFSAAAAAAQDGRNGCALPNARRARNLSIGESVPAAGACARALIRVAKRQ